MLNYKLITCLSLSLGLVACGGSGEPSPAEETSSEPTRAATTAQAEATLQTEREAATVSGECGKGGNDCPDGLECVTFQGGMQACGPESVAAVVLIKDGTLGGRCLAPGATDPYPGASIVSVQMLGNDGNTLGIGRLVWEQAGFEVAAERGTPPKGLEFSGDACTDFFNLGCDGQAVFEIVGADGEVQRLREGQIVVAHLRGQETCDEEVADEIESAICNDPAAAASGNLESCTFKVRMVEARSDLYGPDRLGGTIQYLPGR
jgi:hypothetical protein